MNEKKYLSKNGFEKFTIELKKLKTKGRRQIAEDISEARSKGDLSENAEYHAAKEAQAHLEHKINRIEQILASSHVIDNLKKKNDSIYLFSTVKLLNITTKKYVTYTFVPSEEAHFESGKLSMDSPIGAALKGKAVGEQVDITVPAGQIVFKVISIE